MWYRHVLSAPTFYRFAERILPWLTAAWLGTFFSALLWALWIAPADYKQGEGYRIIYAHVPAAWMSMSTYTAMTVAAIITWIWRVKIAFVFALAAAPIGALFTLLTLFTGSVWGKPMWGAWWVWDARLTSELILLFLYLGFIALRHTLTDRQALQQAGAILLIVGFVNIPVIHFSVEWWNTLHQPATIMKFSAPSIHPDMLKPLLLMSLSFIFFFAVAVLLAMQTELLRSGGEWVNTLQKGH